MVKKMAITFLLVILLCFDSFAYDIKYDTFYNIYKLEDSELFTDVNPKAVQFHGQYIIPMRPDTRSTVGGYTGYVIPMHCLFPCWFGHKKIEYMFTYKTGAGPTGYVYNGCRSYWVPSSLGYVNPLNSSTYYTYVPHGTIVQLQYFDIMNPVFTTIGPTEYLHLGNNYSQNYHVLKGPVVTGTMSNTEGGFGGPFNIYQECYGYEWHTDPTSHYVTEVAV